MSEHPMGCPHCGTALFQRSAGGAKLKARTSILVLHKSGDVEINCRKCGGGVFLPLAAIPGALRKAHAPPRLVVRGNLDAPRKSLP